MSEKIIMIFTFSQAPSAYVTGDTLAGRGGQRRPLTRDNRSVHTQDNLLYAEFAWTKNLSISDLEEVLECIPLVQLRYSMEEKLNLERGDLPKVTWPRKSESALKPRSSDSEPCGCNHCFSHLYLHKDWALSEYEWCYI